MVLQPRTGERMKQPESMTHVGHSSWRFLCSSPTESEVCKVVTALLLLQKKTLTKTNIEEFTQSNQQWLWFIFSLPCTKLPYQYVRDDEWAWHVLSVKIVVDMTRERICREDIVIPYLPYPVCYGVSKGKGWPSAWEFLFIPWIYPIRPKSLISGRQFCFECHYFIFGD